MNRILNVKTKIEERNNILNKPVSWVMPPDNLENHPENV